MNGLIRRQILENLQNVKNLLLTEADIALLIYIESKENVTAADIKSVWDASPQHISTKLKELYSQGYLMRRKFPDPTGGELYVYWFSVRDDD